MASCSVSIDVQPETSEQASSQKKNEHDYSRIDKYNIKIMITAKVHYRASYPYITQFYNNAPIMPFMKYFHVNIWHIFN